MAISNPVTIGTNAPAGTGSTITLTTTAAVSVGGRIVLDVANFGLQTVLSASDGVNTYAIDKAQVSGTQSRMTQLSAECPSGLTLGTVITVTYSASTGDRAITGAYMTGVATGAGSAYGAVGNSQTSTTAWSSTTTTVASGDMLYGGCHWEDSVLASSTPNGGNTELHDGVGKAGSVVTTVYQLGTGAAIAASGTWTNASAPTEGSASVAVVYKAASGGSTDTFTFATTGHSVPAFLLAGMTDSFVFASTGHSAPAFVFAGMTDTFTVATTGKATPAFHLAGMPDAFTFAATGKSAPAFTFAAMTDTFAFATAGHSAPAFAMGGMTDSFTLAVAGASVPSFGVSKSGGAAVVSSDFPFVLLLGG